MGAKVRRNQVRHEQAAAAPSGVDHFSFAAGLAGILISLYAALMLSLHHLLDIGLAGCGPGSPCDRAATSVWGGLPLPAWSEPINRWPTAYIGAAYFAACFVAWLWTLGRPPRALRWIIRIGAIASIGLIAVMLVNKYVCLYCMIAHAGNLLLWIAMEVRGWGSKAPHRIGRTWQPIIAAAALFAIVTVNLGVLEWKNQRASKQEAERNRQASAQQIIAQNTTAAPREDSPYGPTNPFTGRWRLGPESAPIRIVIFSDYQCIDCKRIERDVRSLVEQRPDISLSAKHFPFCRPCNPTLTSDMHPNACWAARAAETAGSLRGNDGFWQMHHWLFDRGGGFTDPELNAALTSMGYDAARFTQIMKSNETLTRVQADVEEATLLGIYRTPMIFINGVEMKGWLTDNNALRKTVDQVTASSPPARTAAADHPPLAFTKIIEDWEQAPLRSMPPDTTAWSIGAHDAPAQIVLWGDYQEPYTAEADALIRNIIASRPDVLYTFRHYPVHRACNPAAQRDLHTNACAMAQAAEAAGLVGGNDAYWRVHAWLMEHQTSFSEQLLRDGLREMSLDTDSVIAAMKRPEVAQAISDDSLAGQRIGLTSIPTIYINGRFAERWQMKGQPVLRAIIDKAARAGK